MGHSDVVGKHFKQGTFPRGSNNNQGLASFAQFLLNFLQSYFLGSHALESTKVVILHEGLASGDLYVQVESNPPYGAGLKYGGISDVAQINYRAIKVSGKPHRAPESMKFNCMPNAPCSGVFEISVSGKQTDIFNLLVISNLSSSKETDWYVVYFPGACVLIVFSFFCCFLFIFNT